MNVIVSFIAACFFYALPVYGSELGWVDSYGNVLKNTESQKWINGFGGWLIVTSDQNWREKWNTPEIGTPVFTEAKYVELGEKITILTLFKNPQVDINNHINLTCDIKITKPDGTVSYEKNDIGCAAEELVGSRENVRLSHVIIDYIGELGDPYGLWVVEVTLNDNNANVSIPLKNSFELKNSATMTKSIQQRKNTAVYVIAESISTNYSDLMYE